MPTAGYNNVLLVAALAASAFAQSAMVSGQVTEALHGKPVAKVTVTLRDREQGTPPISDVYTTRTDAEGRFSISDIAPGRYSLSYDCRGYVWPAHKDGTKVTQPPLILNAGERRTLVLQLVPAGIISGRTVDADGDPVRDVRVEALQYSYTTGKRTLRTIASAQSNDRGEYRLFDVAPGAYLLAANASARIPPMIRSQERVVGSAPQGFAVAFYPDSRTLSSAARIELATGDELHGIDIRLSAESLYTVRIKQPVSRDAVNFALRSRQNDGLDRQMNLPYVLMDGATEFLGVRPGSYVLTALRGTPGGGGPETFARIPIEVVDRDIELDVPLTSGADVTGSVHVDADPAPFPMERVHIYLRSEDPFSIRDPDTAAGANGNFVLHGVLPESYTLQVSTPPGSYLKSVKLGDRVLSGRQVDFSGAAAPLSILLATDGGSISGSVENAVGEPSAGTAVTLFPEGGLHDRSDLARTVDTDNAGKYAIRDVIPGDYRIYAWASADLYSVFDPDLRRHYEGESVTVSVAARGDVVMALKTVVQK